jgi:hypothetical protein
MKTLAISKPVVILQASGNTIWASGLVVMTSRLQRGDRLFDSGLAHSSLSERLQSKEQVLFNNFFRIITRG